MTIILSAIALFLWLAICLAVSISVFFPDLGKSHYQRQLEYDAIEAYWLQVNSRHA